MQNRIFSPPQWEDMGQVSNVQVPDGPDMAPHMAPYMAPYEGPQPILWDTFSSKSVPVAPHGFSLAMTSTSGDELNLGQHDQVRSFSASDG